MTRLFLCRSKVSAAQGRKSRSDAVAHDIIVKERMARGTQQVDARGRSAVFLDIAEKTGNPAAAKDHYRKFLEGMTAADPGLPEVADAQKRLSALK